MSNQDTIERNRRVAETFLNGTHSKNIEGVAIIDRTVVPDVVCHGFPGGEPHDHESYKNFFRVFRQSFTDMDWKVHALVADETHVSVRWQIWATHSGEFAGVKADGRRITFDGMVLYRMEEGRIAETWLHINQMMLMSALGAVPAMAA